MNYTLIVFRREALQPFGKKMYLFSTRLHEPIEQALTRLFPEYEDENCIVIDENNSFGNTHDRRFNVIQMHSISEIEIRKGAQQ